MKLKTIIFASSALFSLGIAKNTVNAQANNVRLYTKVSNINQVKNVQATKATVITKDDTAGSIANENQGKMDDVMSKTKTKATTKVKDNTALTVDIVQKKELKQVVLKNNDDYAKQMKADSDIKLAQKQNLVKQQSQNKPAQPQATNDASKFASRPAPAPRKVVNSTPKPAPVYTGNNLKDYVLTKMEQGTGVSKSVWNYIITRESGWNPTIYNSQGYYGLFQLAPGYPGNGKNVDAQIQNAIYLYHVQGLHAWSTWG